MTGPPFKSSPLAALCLRNILLLFAIVGAWGGYHVAVKDPWAAFAFLFAVIPLIVYYRSRMMGEVVADEDGLEIEQDGRSFRLEWTDLTGLRSLIFFNPAVYRITYGPAPSVTYFVPSSDNNPLIGNMELEIGPKGGYIEAKCKEAGNVIWVRLS